VRPLRIAIVGFGKIAADQHAPSIAANPRFELAATVSRQGAGVPGVPAFPDVEALLGAKLALDAAALTMPPSARYPIARACLEAGLHTMLEKPPGVTLGEVEELARLARARELTLMTTWHAQANPAVAAAADLLAGQRIASMRIVWREDVRKWHPGQQWIWEPGGFGVFDPGINALSIASHVVAGPLFVREADLLYPSNRQTPIAARIGFASPIASGPLAAEFDWRHSGGEAWTIEIETEAGVAVKLLDGGSRLEVDGAPVEGPGAGEYPALYGRFVDLIDCRASLVDLEPLRLVADAFLLGRRTLVEPFEDQRAPA
jgi:predicted dehydrogenase